MARAPVESRIPVFCHTGVKAPLASRLSRPLATLSNKVRAHLTGGGGGSCGGGGGGGGGGGSSSSGNASLDGKEQSPPPACRSDLSLSELSSQQEWLFRKTALQDDTPTMATNSKHSSFELDESLGILTPDQMAESPLCDELPSLLLMSEDYQGYQGDGEFSRPASPGKPNPMTDSDFFTESDADMHEEVQPAPTGDRRAQVIDGRLYQQARCPPSFLAAEEMDSSGVYSDTDRTPRAAELEYSPAKLSSLIMEQVNTIKNLVVSVPMEDEAIRCDSPDGMQSEPSLVVVVQDDEGSQMPMLQEHQQQSPQQDAQSPASQQQRSPPQEEDSSSGPAVKKHKMPKRNVVSKIKTMISSAGKEKPQEEPRRPRRAAGCSRWDAVMNKIAQGQAEAVARPSLKQVKSRVFAGMSVAPPPPRKTTAQQQHSQAPLKAKSRRSRTRGSESSLQTPASGKSHNSSRNSSISDLSKASPHSVRSKKRESAGGGGRSRSPQSDNSTLSAASRRPSTLPTTPPHAHAPPQRNGNGPSSGGDVKAVNIRKSTSRRSLNSTTAKSAPLRDQNRLSGVGGKTPEPPAPPVVTATSPHELPPPHELPSPPAHETLLPHLQHASAGFEALGVLVNYLVYNLDAFSTPQLKKDLEKMRNDWLKTKLELEEAEVSCSRLQEQLAGQRKHQEDMEAQHMHQLAVHQSQQQMQLVQLTKNHEETLAELEKRLHEQAKVLRAQYDEELDHTKEMHQAALAVAESTLAAFRENTAQELQRVRAAAAEREAELVQRLSAIETEHSELKDQSRRFMESMHMDKDTKLQATAHRCKELQDEVESLRTVLELRSSELQELRRQNETLQVDAELLPPTMQKLTTAQARVEDLEAQLERRTSTEKQLIQENRLLLESVHQESKQKKRLSQHNEELQWKLKQNSEVVNALVTDLSTMSGSMHVQLSPHISATATPKRNTAEMLEFFATRNNLSPCQNNDQSVAIDCSPPQSPKVKGVIEKSDSVSWVLEMDESPEHVVNRLVRRAHSFRQAGSSSPSPAHQSRTLPNPHKRQRSRTSQSLSASSSNLRGKKPARARSFSVDSDGSDVQRKWDECENVETAEVKSYSPMDRSDDNDDLIVVESVGDDMLDYIDIDTKNNIQNELMVSGDISSSESEGSVRSRRLENSSRDDLLLINRDDGLRERGILPKDAAGEAMISEETSDDDDVGSRDSDVEDRSGSSSGDDDSLSGSNSELIDGLAEQKIKTELRQQNNKALKKMSVLLPTIQLSDSPTSAITGMDLSWSEDAELPPTESEG